MSGRSPGRCLRDRCLIGGDAGGVVVPGRGLQHESLLGEIAGTRIEKYTPILPSFYVQYPFWDFQTKPVLDEHHIDQTS